VLDNYLRDFGPQRKKPDGTYESSRLEEAYTIDDEFIELTKVIDVTKPLLAVLDNGKVLTKTNNYPLPEPSRDYFYVDVPLNRIWISTDYINSGRSLKVSYYGAGDYVRNVDIDKIADTVEEIGSYVIGESKNLLDDYKNYRKLFEKWNREYVSLHSVPEQIQHMRKQIDYILKILEKTISVVAYIGRLDFPTDGTFNDGYLGGISPITLYPTDRIADAVDKLNTGLKEVYNKIDLCYTAEINNPIWSGESVTGLIYAANAGPGFIAGTTATIYLKNTPITVVADIVSGREFVFVGDIKNDVKKEIWDFGLGNSCNFPETIEYDGTLYDGKLTQIEKFAGVFKSPYKSKIKVVFNTLNLPDPYYNFRISFRDTSNNIKAEEKKLILFEEPKNIIYDQNSVRITYSSLQYKYLSGIAYLSNGLINFQLPQIQNVVQNTLWSTPINLELINLGQLKSVGYAEIWNGVPTAWQNTPVLNFSVGVPQNKLRKNTDTIKISIKNVFNNSTYTAEFPYWVNSLPCESTLLEEKFCTETYRLPADNYDTLPSSISNVWDSTSSVNDVAIVFADRLVHPNYVGAIRTAPDHEYNLHSNNEYCDYYRVFKGSQPRNNGIIEIKGSFNYGTDVKLSLKLPGQTGWLDLTKYYDLGTFDGKNGDGAVTQFEDISGGKRIYWTSGVYSTYYTDNSYVLKVSVKDGCYISNIKETSW